MRVGLPAGDWGVAKVRELAMERVFESDAANERDPARWDSQNGCLMRGAGGRMSIG